MRRPTSSATAGGTQEGQPRVLWLVSFDVTRGRELCWVHGSAVACTINTAVLILLIEQRTGDHCDRTKHQRTPYATQHCKPPFSSPRSRPPSLSYQLLSQYSLECSSPTQDAQRLLDWRGAYCTTSQGQYFDRNRAGEAVESRQAAGQSSKVEHVVSAPERCCLLQRAQRLEASPPASKKHSARS